MPEFLEVEVLSRADLRDWLAGNHAQAGTAWLVFYKKHTDHYLSIDEIVSELLCWGWVDSVTRGVDADRTSIRISPRNPKSAWSAVNKRKIAENRAARLMQPAGEKMVQIAQENGMWTFLDDVERLEVPDDLATALGALRSVWDGYPRNVKRGTLEWIKTAKRADTRAKRIASVVEDAAQGLRPRNMR
ncbi:MAG: YdeI/OmpD-associated family protein [Pseudomonadota bacterium]